jgi:hypothetical protein
VSDAGRVEDLSPDESPGQERASYTYMRLTLARSASLGNGRSHVKGYLDGKASCSENLPHATLSRANMKPQSQPPVKSGFGETILDRSPDRDVPVHGAVFFVDSYHRYATADIKTSFTARSCDFQASGPAGVRIHAFGYLEPEEAIVQMANASKAKTSYWETPRACKVTERAKRGTRVGEETTLTSAIGTESAPRPTDSPGGSGYSNDGLTTWR